MKYFWWRLADYATGALAGGAAVFLISKYLCNKCAGQYTGILFLAVWVSFMLAVNFVFERIIPKGPRA